MDGVAWLFGGVNEGSTFSFFSVPLFPPPYTVCCALYHSFEESLLWCCRCCAACRGHRPPSQLQMITTIPSRNNSVLRLPLFSVLPSSAATTTPSTASGRPTGGTQGQQPSLLFRRKARGSSVRTERTRGEGGEGGGRRRVRWAAARGRPVPGGGGMVHVRQGLEEGEARRPSLGGHRNGRGIRRLYLGVNGGHLGPGRPRGGKGPV